MRFFNNQDLRSIGQAFGVSDDTAQKRVSRALDKLREHLSRRGISSTAAALSIVLSANAVQAAPAGLAITISAATALTGSVLSTPTMIATTKIIAMTTLQKAFIAVTTAAVIGTGIYEVRQTSNSAHPGSTRRATAGGFGRIKTGRCIKAPMMRPAKRRRHGWNWPRSPRLLPGR